MYGGEGLLLPWGCSRDTRRTGLDVGDRSRDPTEPEVSRVMPLCILAGAIMAWGLMSQMRTTCIGLGVSRVWWRSVICPRGQVT